MSKLHSIIDIKVTTTSDPHFRAFKGGFPETTLRPDSGVDRIPRPSALETVPLIPLNINLYGGNRNTLDMKEDWPFLSGMAGVDVIEYQELQQRSPSSHMVGTVMLMPEVDELVRYVRMDITSKCDYKVAKAQEKLDAMAATADHYKQLAKRSVWSIIKARLTGKE